MALAGWAVTSENSRVNDDDRTIAQLFRIMILSLKKFKKAAADPQPTRHFCEITTVQLGGCNFTRAEPSNLEVVVWFGRHEWKT
jgi:hypothetical protein